MTAKGQEQRNWTKNEISYLKTNWKRFSSKQIGEKLNRSYIAVQRKAKGLGLKKELDYSKIYKEIHKRLKKENLQLYITRQSKAGKKAGEKRARQFKENPKELEKLNKKLIKWVKTHKSFYSKLMKQRIKENPNLPKEIGKKSHITFKQKNPEAYFERQRNAGKIGGTKYRPQGKLNPAWTGGKSREPYTYDFKHISKNERYKQFYCAKCKLKKDLTVHHINYNKKDNRTKNLLVLCRSCHGKTTWMRDYWFAWCCYTKGLNPEELI